MHVRDKGQTYGHGCAAVREMPALQRGDESEEEGGPDWHVVVGPCSVRVHIFYLTSFRVHMFKLHSFNYSCVQLLSISPTLAVQTRHEERISSEYEAIEVHDIAVPGA